MKKCGVVYQITCEDCNQDYIGETARALDVRFKEHKKVKGPLTAIGEHLSGTGHTIDTENIKVLDNEEQWFRRKIKEALYIQEGNPPLNRDRGYELPHIYGHLLSRDRTSDHVAQQHHS